MSRIAAFFSGAGVGAAIAALLYVNHPAARLGDQVERWRARAQKAEWELALPRVRLESLPAPKPVILPSPVAATPPASPGVPSAPVPAAANPAPLSYPDPWLEPTRQEEWDALVSSALESDVEQRLGHTLSPEQVQRLLETLRRLRDAAIGLRPEFLDPEDPDSLRDELTRTLMLVESDRIFRAELGIGVSDFVRGLDGNPVEEVFPAKPIESAR